MSLDWRRAITLQAKADFEAYGRLLRIKGVARSHQLLLLQMATEKLAKAFMTRPGHHPDRTHSMFAKFVESCKARPALRIHLGYGTDQLAYRQFLDSIVGVARSVQDLHPEGSMTRPNVEYPWQSTTPEGPILIAPCEHHFREFDPRTNEPLRKLMYFVERCFSFIDVREL